MKVRDLIEKLKQFDSDDEVVWIDTRDDCSHYQPVFEVLDVEPNRLTSGDGCEYRVVDLTMREYK